MAVIASTGKSRNWVESARRVIDSAWFGTTNTAEQAPLALNNESILAVNAAGTGTVALIKADSSDVVTLTNGATVPSGKTLTVSGTLTLGAAVPVTVAAAGLVPVSAPTGLSNWQPIAATSGTDTTPADGTQFVTSVWVPANMTLTGAAYLIGSVGGTNKVYAVLYDSTGAVLANSALTGGGATVGTAANIQTLDFTATYAAKGPGRFFIGISINGNTARLRTVPAFCQAGIWAGSISQVQGTSPTVAAITAPSGFTADKAPVAFLY